MVACTTGFKRLRNTEEKKMPIRKRKSNDAPYPNNALLVDGVTASRRLEQSMLESLGIYTMTMDSAHEAIHLLMTGVHFDFILVDFDLPIIYGPEFVRQIRVMGIQSKIMGMCTNFNDDNVQLFHDAGANASIEKPLNPEILGEVIGILRNM